MTKKLKVILSVIVLVLAMLPIFLTASFNKKYNDMETYYRREYPQELFEAMHYKFGVITDKKEDSYHWYNYTILIELEDKTFIYHTPDEHLLSANIVIIYNDNENIVYIEEIE